MPTLIPAVRIRKGFRGLGVLAGFVGLLDVSAGTAHAQSTPPPRPAPCPEPKCLRAPLPAPAPPAPSGSGAPSFWSDPDGWVDHVLTEWLWQFFANVIHEALSGILGLLARSVLATPQVALFPVVGQVWTSSQQIVVGVYGIVILCGGIVVMGYQTVQTRTSMKDMLPRLVLGFLAANMSLLCIRTLIDWANALSSAILGDDLGMAQACRILADTLTGHLSTVNNQFSPFYVLFTALVLAVMLVAVADLCGAGDAHGGVGLRESAGLDVPRHAADRKDRFLVVEGFYWSTRHPDRAIDHTDRDRETVLLARRNHSFLGIGFPCWLSLHVW